MGKLDDGLGVRRFDSLDGRIVEVLESRRFSRTARLVRGRRSRAAARFGDVTIDRLADVRRIDRDGQSLRVVSTRCPARLPTCCSKRRSGARRCRCRRRWSCRADRPRGRGLHERPGLSHGAITPAHVVITGNGGVVLTDCAFGAAFESLQWNREQLWREFRVALPRHRLCRASTCAETSRNSDHRAGRHAGPAAAPG